jgi:hypothetical protein
MKTLTKKELLLLDVLDSQFKTLDKIPIDAIDKLRAIVRQAPPEALDEMVKRRIKFCDTIANSELVRRGIYPDTAKIDHLINVFRG